VVLATIHNHDLWTVRGTYGYKPELPARAGTEAVGIVDAVGAEVEGIEVGQRVATGGTFGAWAEYVIAKAGAVVPVPDSIPDEVAAQLIAMPFSAITLVDFLGVESGDVIAQNTANGAVGRLVAQIGASRGITVIGIVRRASDVGELASEGISNIVSTDDDGWKDRVRELAGDRPIRAAVDSVGGSAAGDLLHLLGEGGTLVSFGAMASDRMQLSSGDLIFKQAVVKGFWGSKVSAAMPGESQRALFGELFQLVGSGKLTLPVDSIHPLDDIADAVAASTRPGRVGKVLLRP
jgi:NADPH:quinone reductase-like Zn-dependent oxidoreductase